MGRLVDTELTRCIILTRCWLDNHFNMNVKCRQFVEGEVHPPLHEGVILRRFF